MINKVPEKIIGNVNPEKNINKHNNIVTESNNINNNSITNEIYQELYYDEKKVEKVLATHSVSTGLISTIFLTGSWFYLHKHIQENKISPIIIATIFIFAILSLAQLIIWVTYFVMLSQKDENNANRILGDWSGSVVITPLLSITCLVFLLMFGIINKI